MSTEIDTYQPQGDLQDFRTVGTDPTGGRLVAWSQGLQAAHKIGSALCQTAFVPTNFRNKPEEAAAAILYGDEVGFSPTAALQNIVVISGRPSMYARSMVALVTSKGHDVWTEEATDRKVVVCGRRRGSQHVERSEWTIEKARKAGYTSNKKYETAPEDMLYARAAATVCRRIAPDALAGLAYSIEEMEMENQATRTMTRATATTGEPKKVQRKKPEPAPEPVEPPLQDGPEWITDAQMKAMHASFSEAKLTERDERLAYVTQVVGRDVKSSKDLTKDEASKVIDALKSDNEFGGDDQ